MKNLANRHRAWLRSGVVSLGASFVMVVFQACESTCPRGFAMIENRCRPVAQSAEAGAELDGSITLDAAAAATGDSGPARSTTSGLNMGGSPAKASGGAAAGRSQANPPRALPAAGAGGSAGMAANAPSGAGMAAAMPMPMEVCANAGGENLCDGAELHLCNDSGTSDSVETCADPELCLIGAAHGACATCTPGTYRCDGARLDICDETGQYAMQEMCATAELCKQDAGACTEMLCQPNAVSCSSDSSTLNTCNADGSDFSGTQSCEDKGCDQANRRCNACKPGQKECSGDSLLTCNADGQTTSTTRCEPVGDRECNAAACAGSTCISAPLPRSSPCSRGKCNLLGQCVQCLEASECTENLGPCDDPTCDGGRCGKQYKADGTSCEGNRVCRSGACVPRPRTVPLTSYWSSERLDNYTAGTAAGVSDAQAAGYQYIRIEGYAFEAQQAGTVPLKLYWSSERGDNFTTGTAAGETDAINAAYSFARIEGYVYETEQPGTVPLKSFYNAERGDNFTTGTAAGETDANNAAYGFVRIEGYALVNPNP